MNKALYLGVAQLVARYLGVVEAASSSLVTQTKRESSDVQSELFWLYEHTLQVVCQEHLSGSTIVHVDVRRGLDVGVSEPVLHVFQAPASVKQN